MLAAGTAVSAHRRDEYLQAARLAIDPDRVEIALDLTPGIALADQVLAAIDGNGSASIDSAEARAYAGQVLREIAVDVDGKPAVLELIDTVVPEIEAVRRGEGTLRIRAAASLPRLGAGMHHLRYRNGHRPDIGAYLANALVPADDRVTVGSQRRDAVQRELTIEYSLDADPATRVRGGLAAAAAAALIWLVVSWRPLRPQSPACGGGPEPLSGWPWSSRWVLRPRTRRRHGDSGRAALPPVSRRP